MKRQERVAELLASYPAPWKCSIRRPGDGTIRDKRGRLVVTFAAEDLGYHEAITAAVNLAAGIVDRQPVGPKVCDG